MYGDIDLLPESEKTLDDIQQFDYLYSSIIKKLEETLKQDENIKDHIESVLNGFQNVTKQKKEKIDKINDLAQTEFQQLTYDRHLENLTDLIRNVPVVYYREKNYGIPNEDRPNSNSGNRTESPNKTISTLQSVSVQKPNSKSKVIETSNKSNSSQSIQISNSKQLNKTESSNKTISTPQSVSVQKPNSKSTVIETSNRSGNKKQITFTKAQSNKSLNASSPSNQIQQQQQQKYQPPPPPQHSVVKKDNKTITVVKKNNTRIQLEIPKKQ